MGWLLLFILLFVPPIQAASIQVSDNKPEVQIEDWRLKIICPKCGYVFYNCDIGEIFKLDAVDFVSPKCHPANSKIPIMKKGIKLICPFDHTKAWRNGREDGQDTTQVFTNKGWMPQRVRPQWQE